MRIISGTHKGKHISPDKSFKARPTTDFAKENIFNVLTNYIDIEETDVLDLFSGTGSISYEFASRGAKKIVAIEYNHNHYSFIKKTAKELGFNNISLFKTDFTIACKKLKGTQFDIIFADPPYDLKNIMDVPKAIFDNDLLRNGGIAVIEHPVSVNYSHLPLFNSQRTYGSVNFSIFLK